MDLLKETNYNSEILGMCAQLAASWDVCLEMLSTRRAEEVAIFVPSQNRKETKWRIFVDVADAKNGGTKKKVALGKPTSKEFAVGGPGGAYQLTPRYLEDSVCVCV